MQVMKITRQCDFCGMTELVEFDGRKIHHVSGEELKITGRNHYGDVTRACAHAACLEGRQKLDAYRKLSK